MSEFDDQTEIDLALMTDLEVILTDEDLDRILLEIIRNHFLAMRALYEV